MSGREAYADCPCGAAIQLVVDDRDDTLVWIPIHEEGDRLHAPDLLDYPPPASLLAVGGRDAVDDMARQISEGLRAYDEKYEAAKLTNSEFYRCDCGRFYRWDPDAFEGDEDVEDDEDDEDAEVGMIVPVSVDRLLAWRLDDRFREIHRELHDALVAEGRDPNTEPREWDAYADHPVADGKISIAPTPACQEAWRRACAELPDAAAALSRIGTDEERHTTTEDDDAQT
jgi:hypothetical protein